MCLGKFETRVMIKFAFLISKKVINPQSIIYRCKLDLQFVENEITTVYLKTKSQFLLHVDFRRESAKQAWMSATLLTINPIPFGCHTKIREDNERARLAPMRVHPPVEVLLWWVLIQKNQIPSKSTHKIQNIRPEIRLERIYAVIELYRLICIPTDSE